MKSILQFIQNLSLDITAGAVVMTLFVAEILEVNISYYMLLGLALAIWLIYTTDHLLDAKKTKENVNNPRHAFHKRHFNLILCAAMFAFGLGLWNLSNLPVRTIYFGTALAAISLLYLLYSYKAKKGLNKELFAALVYALGLATAPLSLLQNIRTEFFWVVLIISLLAYANLLLISDFEEHLDRRDAQQSIAIRLDGKWFKRVISSCFILCFILIQVYGIESNNGMAYAVFMLMFIPLVSLYIRPRWASGQVTYRLICDGIFFIPLFYLL